MKCFDTCQAKFIRDTNTACLNLEPTPGFLQTMLASRAFKEEINKEIQRQIMTCYVWSTKDELISKDDVVISSTSHILIRNVEREHEKALLPALENLMKSFKIELKGMY